MFFFFILAASHVNINIDQYGVLSNDFPSNDKISEILSEKSMKLNSENDINRSENLIHKSKSEDIEFKKERQKANREVLKKKNEYYKNFLLSHPETNKILPYFSSKEGNFSNDSLLFDVKFEDEVDKSSKKQVIFDPVDVVQRVKIEKSLNEFPSQKEVSNEAKSNLSKLRIASVANSPSSSSSLENQFQNNQTPTKNKFLKNFESTPTPLRLNTSNPTSLFTSTFRAGHTVYLSYLLIFFFVDLIK
jgi:hypothetical protein